MLWHPCSARLTTSVYPVVAALKKGVRSSLLLSPHPFERAFFDLGIRSHSTGHNHRHHVLTPRDSSTLRGMGGVASIPTDSSRRVQVISAGYSRTGTVSMSMALDRLLDGPVHHGGTQILIRDDDYCRLWIKAYEARNAGNKAETLKLVREATAGFVATADLPPADFMPEMMELYPDAKVVLVRRDPQKWWDSVAALTSRTTPSWLGPVMSPIPGWRYLPSFAAHYSRSTLELAGIMNKNATPTDLIERGGPHILEAHHAKVRALVPKDQLFEFDLGDGWGPLCQFLGLPVPDEPFPRANDGKAADQYATRVLLKVFGVWVGILALSGGSVYLGGRFLNARWN
ncbi:hypothetical protein GGR56DRAFT_624241 [Xylariaceae sp. FL0804]|nr:hypothetical protein GGR56DRAFT_624241 [Xylariaceae sp. FL0804]